MCVSVEIVHVLEQIITEKSSHDDRRLALHQEEGTTGGRSSSHTHPFAYAGEDILRINKRENKISRAEQLQSVSRT